MVQESLRVEPATAPSLIAPGKQLGHTPIYLDHLHGKSPAADFFLAQSFEEVAAGLDRRSYQRGRISSILRKQNIIYGASPETLATIELLKDPGTVCVFAGQQAGFLGGPLLTLIKALGIIKAARLYTKKLKRPVVPIFWIAGDDHDFEEANHTYVLTRQGEICCQAYRTAPDRPVSTSKITLSDREELARALEQLNGCLGETDFTGNLFDLINRCYTPEDTLVTAFGKFMTALSGNLGLLLFSPGDSEAKRLAIPFFKAIVEKQDEMHDLLVAANMRIEGAGYHIQVEKKDDSTHLFYDLEGRLPVRRHGDRFLVGEHALTRAELISRIEEHPERFSPDVMTRPVLQSYLFPVLTQRGGPAEIAYLAQMNQLFELFSVPTPVHKSRPSATIVETRIAKLMSQLEISFEDLPGDIEQVVNRVLAKTFPSNIENDFNALRQSISNEFTGFRDEVLDFDPSLTKFAEQTLGKIDFTLKAFESKVFSAHKKRSQETRDRIYRIATNLFPGRGLQERTLNITYFIARYGMDVVQYLYDRLDSEETAHQLILMSEYED